MYIGQEARTGLPLVRTALELFADEASGHDAADGYLRYVKWRDECDQLPEDALRPPRPRARFGDVYYLQEFAAIPVLDWSPEADLRDVVLRSLQGIAPELTVHDLRQPRRGRPFVSIRRQVIAAAVRARYRVRDIANFLNVSDTTVSRVATTVSPRPPLRFDS